MLCGPQCEHAEPTGCAAWLACALLSTCAQTVKEIGGKGQKQRRVQMEAVVDQLLSHQKVYSARCSAGRGRTHGGRTITRRLQVPTKPFFLPFLPKAEMEAMVEEGVRLALEHEMHVTMERNRKQEELRQALCAGKPIKVRSFAVFVLTPIAHLSPCFPAKPRTLWVYREHIARLPPIGAESY